MKEKAAERSGALFGSGLYCAESVLQAIAEYKGIKSDLIPKIATGFCSGIARASRQCGAVSGAIMAISIFTGRSSPDEPVERTYVPVLTFIKCFQDRFNSSNCRELIGCDLNTEEGQEFFEKNNLFESCREFTQEATRIALEVIENYLRSSKY